MNNDSDLLLVNLPFYSIHAPNYDISIIKSLLSKENIPCVIKYLNLDFSNLENYEFYSRIVNSPIEYNVADYFVIEELLGVNDQYKYINDEYSWILREGAFKSNFLEFLELKAKEVIRISPKIILLSTKYMNLYISIYFAKTIKKILPDIVIILFGELVIGEERARSLKKRFDYIDLVVPDKNYKKLVNILTDLTRCRGDFSIDLFVGDEHAIRDFILDDLPFPDYSDFFMHKNTSFFEPILLLEASRGCYWNKCKFCSSKRISSSNDVKSIGHLIEEVLYFTKKYKITKVEYIDICVNPKSLISFCREISKYDYSIEFFVEIRVDFPVYKIKRLYDSGFKSIQVGIENFSTDLLRKINKGSTKIRNVEFLKICMEANINIIWNLLYGFPEETESHIDENIELIKKIRHLRPPNNVLRVRNEYLSDYYFADKSQIDYNDKPIGLCSSFNIEDKQGLKQIKHNNLIKLIADWQLNNYYKLEYSVGPDFVKIKKSNLDDSVYYVLIDWQSVFFLECKKIINVEKLYKRLNKKFKINRTLFRDHIEFLVSHQLVIKEDDNLLSLAVST